MKGGEGHRCAPSDPVVLSFPARQDGGIATEG